MSWISRFRASGRAQQAASGDEIAIDGVLYDAHNAIRSRPENPDDSAEGADAAIAEDIKRRQVSLALRYVLAVRAR